MAYFWPELWTMKGIAVLWASMVMACLVANAQTEIFNPMKDAIKGGDATTLVKYFAQAVDINLEGNINTYSKAQSEFVLKDFFKKHPVNDFSIVHTGFLTNVSVRLTSAFLHMNRQYWYGHCRIYCASIHNQRLPRKNLFAFRSTHPHQASAQDALRFPPWSVRQNRHVRL